MGAKTLAMMVMKPVKKPWTSEVWPHAWSGALPGGLARVKPMGSRQGVKMSKGSLKLWGNIPVVGKFPGFPKNFLGL